MTSYWYMCGVLVTPPWYRNRSLSLAPVRLTRENEGTGKKWNNSMHDRKDKFLLYILTLNVNFCCHFCRSPRHAKMKKLKQKLNILNEFGVHFSDLPFAEWYKRLVNQRATIGRWTWYFTFYILWKINEFN